MAERTCSVEECSRVVYARGWCGMHWQRWRRSGSLEAPPLTPSRPHFQTDPKTGCWVWTRAKRSGYGLFRDSSAHRVYWELVYGPLPPDLVLDHLCRNRACVNPAHLEPVTNAVNILRGVGLGAQNARKTHCIRGHEFTPENTATDRTSGGRRCLACRKLRYPRRSSDAA